MLPLLFDVFGVPIYTWGFATAFAFVVVIGLSHRLATVEGVSAKPIGDLLFYGSLLGLVGGRVLYYTTHSDEFVSWTFFNPRVGGASMYGALLFILPFFFIYCKKANCNAKQIADIFAPCLAIGLAIHRLGCLGAGCCYGTPTDTLWSIWLHGAWRHPSQLYEAIPLGITAILLLARGPRKNQHGEIVWLFACVYAPLRIVGEWFRASPNRGVIIEDWMTLPQLLTFMAWAIAWVWLRYPYSGEKLNG